jgi:hypothetical protein
MKSTAAHASDIFDGNLITANVLKPRTDTWLQTGTPVFMEISCVFKTGQPAACRESHRGNIFLNKKTNQLI